MCCYDTGYLRTSREMSPCVKRRFTMVPFYRLTCYLVQQDDDDGSDAMDASTKTEERPDLVSEWQSKSSLDKDLTAERIVETEFLCPDDPVRCHAAWCYTRI